MRRADEPAKPAWIIYPEYRRDSETHFSALAKSRAFFRAADNSANYRRLGEVGFRTLTRLMDTCDCYEFTYSSLDEAVTLFGKLERQELVAEA